jgi:1,2-diacylglycerol 3-beta-glucosyltransferase
MCLASGAARNWGIWRPLELMLYLLVPWLLVLPWSIVFHLSLLLMGASLLHHGPLETYGPGAGARVQALVLWYAISFAPNLAAAYLYRRRDRTVSRHNALLLGHMLIPANYIAYAACWRALGRLLRGENGWAKTQRAGESLGALPSSCAHPRVISVPPNTGEGLVGSIVLPTQALPVDHVDAA